MDSAVREGILLHHLIDLFITSLFNVLTCLVANPLHVSDHEESTYPWKTFRRTLNHECVEGLHQANDLHTEIAMVEIMSGKLHIT